MLKIKVWDLKLRTGALKLRFGTKIKDRSLKIQVWDLSFRTGAVKLRFVQN